MDRSFDPSTLKFNDVRDELKRRGLNPLGTKAVLLQRLSTVLTNQGKTLQDFAKSLVKVHSPTHQLANVVQANNTPVAEDCLVIDSIGETEEVQSQNPVALEDCLKSEHDGLRQISKPPISQTILEKDQSASNSKRGVSYDHDFSVEVKNSDSANCPELQACSSARERSSDKDFSQGRDRFRPWNRNHSERVISGAYDHSSDRDKSKTSPSQARESSSVVEEEIDGWEHKENVFLDTYNSDINLVISQDGFSAKPLTDGGFSLMWAGARANFGIERGKSFFEVKFEKELPVDNLQSLGSDGIHVLRIGWSTNTSGLALGDEVNTYGFDGAGKKSTNGVFENYGCKFKEGDIVGAFLEITDSKAIMSFSVNGKNQGECYLVSKSFTDCRFALFPHVYVKNVEFKVNFGQENQPSWFSPSTNPDSWKLINVVPYQDRIRASAPPASKTDCEVIMMIGLPGSGKTVYSNNLCKKKPEKQYNILSTNSIFEKMKVTEFARKTNQHGQLDALIEKSNECLNKLILVACKRRRNYILDQANVYPPAQRRKMRLFEGFQRRAIVVIPTDEEFKRRINQRSKEEGKYVPEKAVLEMKADFEIPKSIVEYPSSVFDEVIFTELQRAEAEALVKQYNAEGKASRQNEKRHYTDSSDYREFSSGRHADDHNYHHRDNRSRFDSCSGPGRDDNDRRESRGGGRLEYRNERGTGRDRGRLGPRYCDEGRDLGIREGGRYGNSGRFDNDGDFRDIERSAYGGGFRRSPRVRGGFNGAPDRAYSGSQQDQYGFNKPHLGRGGYRGEGRSDGYSRGNGNSRGGYGGVGYNYHQTNEKRRGDQGVDSSGGPPPAKQSAIGEGQHRGGFQGDGGSYMGAFRGSRGATFGSSRGGNYSQISQGPARHPGSTYSGSYHGAYGQQSQHQDLPTSNDRTSKTYQSSGFGHGDSFLKSQQHGSGSSGRTSKLSSAIPGESMQSDAASTQAVASRCRSKYTAAQDYNYEKESPNQPEPRSCFDQSDLSAQQNQGTYGGGSYNQQSKARQPTSTIGSTQVYDYGYDGHQSGGLQPSPQKPQVFGNDFTSRQQQKPSQRGNYGYGGATHNYSGHQQPQAVESSQQKYYKSYGDDQLNGAFNKPGQQQFQGYGSQACIQRVGGSVNSGIVKSQQGYGGDFQSGKTSLKHGQESQGTYYQGYGGGQPEAGSNKPSQQSNYGVLAYGSQGGSLFSPSQQNYSGYSQQGTVTKTGQSYQQRYGIESSSGGTGGYGQDGSNASKSDPQTYDYSTGVNYASYGYGSAFNSGGNAATPVANTTMSAAVVRAVATTTFSPYASALNAASKSTSDSSRVAAQGYASATSTQPLQTSLYNHGARSYYGGAAAATSSWFFSANPSAGGGGSQPQQGPIGGSGAGYGQS